MVAALGWGALAASSLVLGAALALRRDWSERLVGLVVGFGAGALISAVSFELAQEGVEAGGAGAVRIGFALGALTFYFLDGIALQGRPLGRRRHAALGAFLDGIPEQMVLGLGPGRAAGLATALGFAVAAGLSSLS